MGSGRIAVRGAEGGETTSGKAIKKGRKGYLIDLLFSTAYSYFSGIFNYEKARFVFPLVESNPCFRIPPCKPVFLSPL